MSHDFVIRAQQIRLTVPNEDPISTSKGRVSLRWILSDTERNSKKSLESIARCFKNEMRFDHAQYDASEHYDDSCIGFIIVEQNFSKTVDYDKENIQFHYVIGGGCFRNGLNELKELNFIWLHPYARRREITQTIWKIFNKKFTKFTLTEPLSASMINFLEKNDKDKISYRNN